MEWCYVCVSCESDSLGKWRVAAHFKCTQCSIMLNLRYMIPVLYWFMADIANLELFVCSCWTWICLDITHFYEEQRQPSSGSARSALPKNWRFLQ